MCIGLCRNEVYSPGLTMLPPRAKDHPTKSPASGVRSPLFQLLVRVVQGTPKTLQAMDIAPGCPHPSP